MRLGSFRPSDPMWRSVTVRVYCSSCVETAARARGLPGTGGMILQNPAPLIRSAARIMEARAQRASPGPWSVEHWHDTFWIAAGDENPMTMDLSRSGIMLDPDNIEGGKSDAEHIASWPPSMALH